MKSWIWDFLAYNCVEHAVQEQNSIQQGGVISLHLCFLTISRAYLAKTCSFLPTLKPWRANYCSVLLIDSQPVPHKHLGQSSFFAQCHGRTRNRSTAHPPMDLPSVQCSPKPTSCGRSWRTLELFLHLQRLQETSPLWAQAEQLHEVYFICNPTALPSMKFNLFATPLHFQVGCPEAASRTNFCISLRD